MNIAVDVMSGDGGFNIAIPACILAISRWKDLHITLVGDESLIKKELVKNNQSKNHRFSTIHADEVIEMDESPIISLRNKKKSSMRIAINSVKDKITDGCLSAGNTGALMAIAKFVLKTMNSIERPAICTALPCRKGWVYALDLGANVEVSPAQLLQFAIMGSAMAESVENLTQKPLVGLMNIGSEELKGSKTIQQAHQLIGQCKSICYNGFVEGDDIFNGDVDVIVMGGNEGNISLKTSEGLAKFIRYIFKREFARNWLTKLGAFFCQPIIKKIAQAINPHDYNGACLLGLNGIVVKSHGNTTVEGFANAIGVTRKLIANKTITKIQSFMKEDC